MSAEQRLDPLADIKEAAGQARPPVSSSVDGAPPKYLGVCLMKRGGTDMYLATLRAGGRVQYMGYHRSAEAAALAVDRLRLLDNPAFPASKLNFPHHNWGSDPLVLALRARGASIGECAAALRPAAGSGSLPRTRERAGPRKPAALRSSAAERPAWRALAARQQRAGGLDEGGNAQLALDWLQAAQGAAQALRLWDVENDVDAGAATDWMALLGQLRLAAFRGSFEDALKLTRVMARYQQEPLGVCLQLCCEACGEVASLHATMASIDPISLSLAAKLWLDQQL